MRAGQGGRVVMSATNDAGQTWAPARSVNLPNPDSAIAGLVAGSGDNWLALNPTAAGRQSLALLKANSDGSIDTAKTLFVEGSAEASQAGNGLTIADHTALLGRELKAQGASDADIQAYIGSAARQLCGPSTCAKEFSYPFLLQTRDGAIHLVYTWHRSRIKHVRMDHAALD
jgi:predicted neuraminidase